MSIFEKILSKLRYRFGPKVSLLILTISASLCYGILWKVLNVWFPIIGEGLDGYGVSSIASVAFALHFRAAIKTKDAPEPEQVIRHAFVSTLVCVPAGRVIFTFVPPFYNNAIGAVLGFFLAPVMSSTIERLSSTSDKKKPVLNRGPEVGTAAQAKNNIPATGISGEPTFEWAGFIVPADVAEGNLLCVGFIGTGKTRMHRETMASVFPTIVPGSGRRALIYDVKSDALAEIRTMKFTCEVIVMDPYDERSLAWNLAEDFTTSSDALNLARAFIPDSMGTADKPYFVNSARRFIGAVIQQLIQRAPNTWTLRDMIYILSEPSKLKKFLAGTLTASAYFNGSEAEGDTISTVANTMLTLSPVAACWEHAPKFSLRKWAASSESILVLAGKVKEEALESINRIMCDVVTADLSKGPESHGKSKFWFFCDEVKDAGRIDSLPLLLNGRSKGVRCVLGFQDLEGLIIAYGGDDKAMEIPGRCGSISWLKLNSTKTAEWAASRCGKSESFEYTEATSKDGTTITEHLNVRDSILASEFTHLPTKSGQAAGIHIFHKVRGIYKSTAQYAYPKNLDPKENFKPWSDLAKRQLLSPWTSEDDRRLGIDGDDEVRSPTSPPTPINPVVLPPEAGLPDIDPIVF